MASPASTQDWAVEAVVAEVADTLHNRVANLLVAVYSQPDRLPIHQDLLPLPILGNHSRIAYKREKKGKKCSYSLENKSAYSDISKTIT